jgi:hypothetical protein
VHRGPGTLTENFGGEGTGLKSWNFELGWKTGTWYTLVSRCWPVEDHMFYGFWARSGETKQWTHLVTMDVAAKDAYFNGGTDAFIEDWLETGKDKRTTNLRGGWKRKRSGEWHAFGSGRYSVNAWDLVEGKRSFNFRTNWNGGVGKDEGGEFYFMTAGGAETAPATDNPSTHSLKRDEARPGYEPIRIKSAQARIGEDGPIEVSWENDPETLPQFKVVIEVHAGAGQTDGLIAEWEVAEPHRRTMKAKPVVAMDPKLALVRVRAVDILGNISSPVTVGFSD